MQTKLILTIVFTFALVLSVQPAAAQEPGEDHPLLSRFAPASLTHYDQVNYDAVNFPAGPIGENGEPEHVFESEGRITWIGYRVPEEHSRLEVIRNYDIAFAESDFEILYSCEGEECGNERDLRSWLVDHTFARGTTDQSTSPAKWIDWTRNDERTRLYLLKQEVEETVVHIFLIITGDWYGSQPTKVGQVVVEGELMETGQVEVGVLTAGELQTSLEEEGKVIVPGIFFEFDSAELRAESHEALEQMAELMRNTPGMRVHIVGHTDIEGSFEYNLNLSEQRAQAVYQALINDYGIEAGRMVANGVAWMAPITNNSTEEGREQNRRVELVLVEM